jgi:Putative amidoligase enzyme
MLLASTCNTIFGSRLVQGDVFGIECEMEFPRPFDLNLPERFQWVVKEDGSLRNYGLEFVTAKPSNVSITCEKVDKLFEYLGERAIVDTNRTSVHVHMNFSNKTWLQTITAITMYYLFEPLLLEIAGEERKGNMFCVSSRESIDNTDVLIESIQDNRVIDSRRFNKYSSLNLLSLGTFGTLESRIMRGEYKRGPGYINSWIFLLNDILFGSIKTFVNPSKIMEEAVKDPYSLLKKVLSKGSLEFLKTELGENNVISLSSVGLSNAMLLADCSPDDWSGTTDWRNRPGYAARANAHGINLRRNNINDLSRDFFEERQNQGVNEAVIPAPRRDNEMIFDPGAINWQIQPQNFLNLDELAVAADLRGNNAGRIPQRQAAGGQWHEVFAGDGLMPQPLEDR